MKKILLFLLIMFIPFYINAEELKMDWQKSWGGSAYEYFTGLSLTKTEDLIAYGYTLSNDIDGLVNKSSMRDATLVKYDKDGNLLWQKNWGSFNAEFSDASLTETDDIIVVGNTVLRYSNGTSNQDAIIVKYNKNGTIMWEKNWGGSAADSFSNIILTETGDIIVSGYTSSENDAALVKYDKDGNLLWQKSWGESGYEQFTNFILTETGDIIVIGYTSPSYYNSAISNDTDADATILKYDKNGNLIWEKNWGGSAADYFSNLILTETGDIIASGYTSSKDIDGLTNKGVRDAALVKYDKDGNLIWQKNWGSYGPDEFTGLSLTETGDIIVSGCASPINMEGLTYNGSADAIVVKYDKDGNLLWQKSWGGRGADNFNSLTLTETGEIITYGYDEAPAAEGLTNKGKYDAIIVKYDKDGNLLWQKSWGGNEEDKFTGLCLIQTGNVVVYGYSSSTDIEGLPNKGYQDTIIVKYSLEYNLENVTTENGTSTVEQQGKHGIITALPNEGYKVGTIIIKDKNGKVLDLEITKQEDGTYSFELYTDVTVEVNFVREYTISLVYTKNGEVEVDKIDADHGKVIFTPHSGFEFDKVIVKNSKGELVDVIKQDDESYLFELNDDVSVEVVFKRELVNPKTGVTNSVLALFIGFIISMIGFLIVKKYNERLEI